jgi:g-D-glutamyl-meso-diaminopimelate peptidase
MLIPHAAIPLTQKELETSIARLRGQSPALWVTSIGRSILRRPLLCLRLGHGRPRMLYVATHHAMEWITGTLLLLFARYLLEEEPKGTAPRGTFYLLPCLNPDGVSLVTEGYDPTCILAARQLRYNGGSTDFSHWQANARGVDLNHNYDAGFDAYRAVERTLGIEDGAPTRYSGASPLSEPETSALISLHNAIAPDAVLTLHTQGRELYCGEGVHPHTRLAAAILARRAGYRLASPTGPAAYGGLTDQLCRMGTPALTLECGQGVNPLPASCLPHLWQEVLPLLLHAPRLLPAASKL